MMLGHYARRVFKQCPTYARTHALTENPLA